MVDRLTSLPVTKFQVQPEDDIFNVKQTEAKRNRTSAKVKRVVLWILSILIVPIALARLTAMGFRYLVSRIILPASSPFFMNFSKRDLAQLSREREKLLADPANHAEQVTVETADGVKLDTVAIEHPDQKNLPAYEQKWILKFDGNGSYYEAHLKNALQLSRETGASFYTGNYRGVIRSEGRAKRAQDLILDGEAMLQYLLQKGVRPENILIHGHSLGGGVGTAVAARHPGVNLCNDRSFASIKAVVGPIIGKLIERWNFDSVKNYQAVSGEKFILFSSKDKVINCSASLFKKLWETPKSIARAYEFGYFFEVQKDIHNISLSEAKYLYPKYLREVRDILHLKKPEPVLASYF